MTKKNDINHLQELKKLWETNFSDFFKHNFDRKSQLGKKKVPNDAKISRKKNKNLKSIMWAHDLIEAKHPVT